MVDKRDHPEIGQRVFVNIQLGRERSLGVIQANLVIANITQAEGNGTIQFTMADQDAPHAGYSFIKYCSDELRLYPRRLWQIEINAEEYYLGADHLAKE